MRKIISGLTLSAMLLLTGVSANAAQEAAVPAFSGLLKGIPEEYRQRARAGEDLTVELALSGDGFTLEWGENEGANYILKLSTDPSAASGETAAKCGVYDFAANEWRIPCIYDAVYWIPEHRFFLVVEDGERSICYEAEADGTVNPEPLPIDGKVGGVDRQGYVTLYRSREVELSYSSVREVATARHCLSALLDDQYQMVLDYVCGSESPGAICFEDGVALIETGGTSFVGTHMGLAWSGSTIGFINRKGEWVGSHDYEDVYCFRDSNARVWAYRGDKIYWLVEDGGEVELKLYDTQDPSELEDRCSGWAKAPIEQARARGLLPENVQGYYTLDAYREELCALLVNLYGKLGRELPALDTAPVFTDCEREHVRLAAALGIVSGGEDGTIHPRSRITRQEAADVLYRFIRLFQEADGTALKPYPDDAAIGDAFKTPVYAMQKLDIMSGMQDGGFAPQAYYPLEQAIATVNKLYELLSAGTAA